MDIKKRALIAPGQDGAIYGGYLFRFDGQGTCHVYDMSAIKAIDGQISEPDQITSFVLDKAELIVPHSNAVVFGSEYYADGDEFPLLYSNVYNNYYKEADRLEGVCCVYRLERDGKKFDTTLVQIIEIGFAKEVGAWSSCKEEIRPYGNFVIDAENGVYHGFTMRDEDKTTRFFAFDLPKACDGETDSRFGVKRVVLGESDIKDSFDIGYQNFVQGACFCGGKIYSLEGFSSESGKVPALRVVDIAAKREELYVDFAAHGIDIEPEMIDFAEGVCYYGDGEGNVYTIEF